MKPRATKVLLLLLCFATTSSTAGLIQQPRFSDVTAKVSTTAKTLMEKNAYNNRSAGESASKEINKDGIGYKDYPIEDDLTEQALMTTTTKEEIAYTVLSIDESPSFNDSNNPNEPLVSEEEENTKKTKNLKETRFLDGTTQVSTTAAITLVQKNANKNWSTGENTSKEVDGIGYEDYFIEDDSTTRALMTTTTKEEIAYTVQSVDESPSFNELNNPNEPLVSEEEENTKKTKNLKETSQIRDEKSIKKEISTSSVSTTKKEEISSHKTSHKITIVETSTDKGYSQSYSSTMKLLVSATETKKDGIEYEDYPIEDESTKRVLTTTTTKEEIAYTVQSVDHDPSFYESNNPNEPLLSEEEETTKKPKKLKETSFLDGKTKVSTTAKTLMEKNAHNNWSAGENTPKEIIKDGIEYEDYPIEDETKQTLTTTTTKEEIAYTVQSVDDNPLFNQSNTPNESLLSEEEETTKKLKKLIETSFSDGTTQVLTTAITFVEKNAYDNRFTGENISKEINKDGIAYEDYPIEDESTTQAMTTTKKEITYTVLVDTTTTKDYIEYDEYTLPDQMTDSSVHNTPSDSNQEQIDFVPLDNNAATGTHKWDERYFTATNEPMNSINSEENEQMSENPSISNNEVDGENIDLEDSDSKNENDVPNTYENEEVPAVKNKGLALLDLLKSYINQNGINIDKLMEENPSPSDPSSVLLHHYKRLSKKKNHWYSEKKEDDNPYRLYIEKVKTEALQSLYRY